MDTMYPLVVSVFGTFFVLTATLMQANIELAHISAWQERIRQLDPDGALAARPKMHIAGATHGYDNPEAISWVPLQKLRSIEKLSVSANAWLWMSLGTGFLLVASLFELFDGADYQYTYTSAAGLALIGLATLIAWHSTRSFAEQGRHECDQAYRDARGEDAYRDRVQRIKKRSFWSGAAWYLRLYGRAMVAPFRR